MASQETKATTPASPLSSCPGGFQAHVDLSSSHQRKHVVSSPCTLISNWYPLQTFLATAPLVVVECNFFLVQQNRHETSNGTVPASSMQPPRVRVARRNLAIGRCSSEPFVCRNLPKTPCPRHARYRLVLAISTFQVTAITNV